MKAINRNSDSSISLLLLFGILNHIFMNSEVDSRAQPKQRCNVTQCTNDRIDWTQNHTKLTRANFKKAHSADCTQNQKSTECKWLWMNIMTFQVNETWCDEYHYGRWQKRCGIQNQRWTLFVTASSGPCSFYTVCACVCVFVCIDDPEEIRNMYENTRSKWTDDRNDKATRANQQRRSEDNPSPYWDSQPRAC